MNHSLKFMATWGIIIILIIDVWLGFTYERRKARTDFYIMAALTIILVPLSLVVFT